MGKDMRITLALAALATVSACVSPRVADQGTAPVDVKIIALNDFHGALEPPRTAIPATTPAGAAIRVPAGGAAYLASAVQSLKAANANNVVVSAGDLISASPLISSHFLDEPTILAMNLIGLDFNAVGNHEFDRGRKELLRMQEGGCEKNTHLDPCRVDADFGGADFKFLGANVITESGGTLFPSHGIRSFGSGARKVEVGFIGLTLKTTPTLVSPGGVAGLTFKDEAASINALIPKLKAEGADAIVVLIHQGVYSKAGYNTKTCDGVTGDLLPILPRLDPGIDVIVSGHTHQSYICDYGTVDPQRPFLLTSAGRSGTLLTDITLSINPASGKVVKRGADNVIVQGEAYQSSSGPVETNAAFARFPQEPRVAALVSRYATAVAPVAQRVAGQFDGSALRETSPAGESVLGALIADAHLDATSAPDAGGAQVAFSNAGGLRADIVPGEGGAVTYGQLISAQPFGNTLVVQSFTGLQIRALLEQQFDSGTNTVAQPNMLMPSRGFTYSYDLSRPAGKRIVDPRLNGEPLRDDTVYRVATNSFLASGGDNFTVFTQGADTVGGPIDVDALEAYIVKAGRLKPPAANRVKRIN
ncbi:bifunctional metallophosphatase/5'-nucleotidase [Allosphingosinicella vermicomposti]|uniref:bifunctional metallophosphatase/5'-nucleotidase n=1 Tax=Allosphingosinicella vermicomposti TaxID=614671 RepID=UPI000D0E76B8|nr:bifunctional metallophosphatase/5'-nucleotidase [Allosphingosinicella vermicomposti]